MSDPRDTLDNNSKGMTEEPATRQKRLYASILERIFFTHFDQGETDFVLDSIHNNLGEWVSNRGIGNATWQEKRLDAKTQQLSRSHRLQEP